MPVVVLSTTAGFHIPVMPLSEVTGNEGAAVPLQIEVGNEKIGVIVALTVKFNVAIESQFTAFVKVA